MQKNDQLVWTADEAYAVLTRLLDALTAIKETRDRMAQVVPPWQPTRRQ
jgi:hypothetical protein